LWTLRKVREGERKRRGEDEPIFKRFIKASHDLLCFFILYSRMEQSFTKVRGKRRRERRRRGRG
jgi:hypothetical protein